MTPITCAKPSPPRARSQSSPTTRHARSNIRSTSISMRSAISSNAASQNSSNSAALQPGSKRPPEITVPSSLSLPSSYGCDKCPHHLEHPDTATSLNDLAVVLEEQGDFAESEALRERSLAIYEKALGVDHPYLAT